MNKNTNGLSDFNTYCKILAEIRRQEEEKNPELKKEPLIDIQINRGTATFIIKEQEEVEKEL